MMRRKGFAAMSHSHVRKPKLTSRPSLRIGTAIVVLLIAGFFGEILAIRWVNGDVEHITAKGTVLETRIDAVGTGNSIYGGYIYFQLEARVRYRSESGDEVRWMPASEVSTSRELLATRLASHPKSCYVAWQAGHPESPRCEFVPSASLHSDF